jgi:hypothetical protein
MPALVAGIHVLLRLIFKDVDGRDKPGHDVERTPFTSTTADSSPH